MAELRNRARIDQTSRELEYLHNEITTWIEERNKKDEHRQYQTQLKVLNSVLTDALQRLRLEIQKVADTGPSSTVYVTCRQYDERLIWVRRVWDYYRVKFDQRDDPKLAPALAAADEVVWSCYAAVFENAQFVDNSIAMGPAPLPYFEPLYSPYAIPRDDPPAELESNIDNDFLKEFLGKLPIPIVSLPPYCVQSPWWLALLGHETGHHVQYDLLPEWALIASFRDDLSAAIVAEEPEPEGSDEDAARWAKWGKEIFADVFSICMLGPWAVWAMNELETQEEIAMLRRKSLYPAPVVRLALMAQVVDDLELDGKRMLAELDPKEVVTGAPIMVGNTDLREWAAADLKFVPKMSKKALNAGLGDLGSLKTLSGWRKKEFDEAGRVAAWHARLLGRGDLLNEKRLSAPRYIASAGVGAWSEVSAVADQIQQAEGLARLAETLPKVIVDNRVEGTRSAASERRIEEKLGDQLADWLLESGTLG